MHDSYGPSLEVVHITSTYNPLINSITLPPLIVRETVACSLLVSIKKEKKMILVIS